ncbi:MAG: leucine-rich repeat domain-containing protein [Clostridium sp.]|nr:leucine-rich repeat domain-containing protein [Clostridium sp.]
MHLKKTTLLAKTLTLILATAIPALSNAWTFKKFTLDGLEYATVSDSEVKVYSFVDKSIKHVAIPASVNDGGTSYAVRSISARTFENSDIESVSLPDAIQLIEQRAFNGCKALTSINCPPSLTEIAANCFSGCSSLEKFDIGPGVATIGDGAFSGTALKSFTVPESVKSLGGAFSSCAQLEYLEINAPIAKIPNSFASNCSKLKEVAFPEGVAAIGNSAFYACKSFDPSCLPGGITDIGASAFYSCGFTEFPFLESLVNIGASAFERNELRHFQFSDALQTIGENAFQDVHIQEITLPATMKSIGAYALHGIARINILSDKPFDISANAFDRYRSMTNVSKPPLIFIPSDAAYAEFSKDETWKAFNLINASPSKDVEIELSIPGNLTKEIYQKHRLLPPQISRLKVKGEINADDIAAINSTMTSLIKLDLKDAIVEDLPAESFKGNATITEIILPRSLKIIKKHTFQEMPHLLSVELSEDLEEIWPQAFYECKFLWNDSEVEFPASLRRIGDTSFTCLLAKKLIFNEGLETIEYAAFSNGDTNFDNLPNSLINLSNDAFRSNSGVPHSLILSGSIKEIGNLAFSETPVNFLQLGEGTEKVWYRSFFRCADLHSIVLPSTVNQIGNDAFKECSNAIFLKVDASTPPQCGTGVFDGVDLDKLTFVYPSEAFLDYALAPVWGDLMLNRSSITVEIDPDAPQGQILVTSSGRPVNIESGTAIGAPSSSTVELEFAPSEGLFVSKVLLDGKDVTHKVINNRLEIEAASADHTLKASFGSESAGIEDILQGQDSPEKAPEIYNLNGQKISNPARGLYIINGKKTIL